VLTPKVILGKPYCTLVAPTSTSAGTQSPRPTSMSDIATIALIDPLKAGYGPVEWVELGIMIGPLPCVDMLASEAR
jgi:hypothetical protein